MQISEKCQCELKNRYPKINLKKKLKPRKKNETRIDKKKIEQQKIRSCLIETRKIISTKRERDRKRGKSDHKFY